MLVSVTTISVLLSDALTTASDSLGLELLLTDKACVNSRLFGLPSNLRTSLHKALETSGSEYTLSKGGLNESMCGRQAAT